MSMRYGVGVGRDGFAWSGDATIHDKQAWPKWFPPKEMMERQPETAQYADGMEGGVKNPLGARALYLWQGNKDTLYRLHGTNEPASIGHAMSSGCIRLLNQDIIDLYERVPLGASVVVLAGPETLPLDQAMTPAAQVDRL
jgi:lipoprotein-anchoring transpeptidase ErfK/SrfK